MLVPELNGSYVPDVDVINSQGVLEVSRKHSTLGQLLRHGVLDERSARRLLKFTTVRNPFDSLYNLYVMQSSSYQRYLGNDEGFLHHSPAYAEQVRRSRDLSFDEWLVRKVRRRRRLRDGLRGRRQFEMYRPYTEGADVILRFESLQRDFDALLASKDLPPTPIPRINAQSSERTPTVTSTARLDAGSSSCTTRGTWSASSTSFEYVPDALVRTQLWRA